VLGGRVTGVSKTFTEQVVAERQWLMKLQGASMQALQVRLKRGDFDAIPVNVEALVVTSQQIPQPGSQTVDHLLRRSRVVFDHENPPRVIDHAFTRSNDPPWEAA